MTIGSIAVSWTLLIGCYFTNKVLPTTKYVNSSDGVYKDSSALILGSLAQYYLVYFVLLVLFFKKGMLEK